MHMLNVIISYLNYEETSGGEVSSKFKYCNKRFNTRIKKYPKKSIVIKHIAITHNSAYKSYNSYEIPYNVEAPINRVVAVYKIDVVKIAFIKILV